MKIPSQLAAIPLFEGLSEENYADLAAIVLDKVFHKGQTIFSEGEEGNGFYVVVAGRLKIFKLSREGKEQILHIFGAGEPFGEVPVFAGQRFPANAEALEDCRVFFFPRAAFVELIKRNPSLALNMLAVLSRRLRQFTLLIEDLSLKEVPGRLAAYLLYLSHQQAGSDEVELDIPKNLLASLLGTIPETLSRILARMIRQGLIEAEGPRIKIVDRQGLQALAVVGSYRST
ncbi:MAG: transcriptional regulator [Desulfobacca sp. 4484_104]|nr:MAG: transcriptional regulator [Desulfobacca sp. 4484_104]RLA88306.1 MAG: Crp/Fnr family transcriptional regulator [Deltaproteobacteria bacterium]